VRAAAAQGTPEVMLRIREELARKNIKHKDLAAHLGITGKHMSQMMCGRNNMSLPILFRILAHLNLSILLFPEEEDPRVRAALALADEMDNVHGSIRGHVTTYQLRQALAGDENA
jgi:transcriptional regulator with XRE-family HTH domain